MRTVVGYQADTCEKVRDTKQEAVKDELLIYFSQNTEGLDESVENFAQLMVQEPDAFMKMLKQISYKQWISD